MKTLISLIEKLPDYSDKPAVVEMQKGGIRRWSYKELGRYVEQLASGLIKSGVTAGDSVAIVAGQRPEWIVACLAIVRAGGVVVPLDNQLRVGVLTDVLKDCGARFIFARAEKIKQIEGLRVDADFELFSLGDDEEHGRSWNRLLAEVQDGFPSADPDDRATIFYTSGTTGPPKGVPLTHGNIAFQLQTLLESELITEEERVLLPLPLHHVYPFAIGMLFPLACGATIIFPQAMTGPQILRASKEGEATAIIGVPRLYDAFYSGIRSTFEAKGFLQVGLFDAGVTLCGWLRSWFGVYVGRLLLKPLHQKMGSRLRILASGGSLLDPILAGKLEGIGWQVAIGYGLTETAPLLTINKPGKAKLGSVGRPIAGVEIRIDPSEAAEPAEKREALQKEGSRMTGEVLARGPNVFEGYLNLPDKTKQSFTKEGWFRTGDLGYFDDEGYLYILGRISTLIVTQSGEKIQPEELEEFYEKSPLIREVGILQREGKLVALIVPELSEIRKQGLEDIKRAVWESIEERSKHLASYQRVADVAITRKPPARTRLGKIQRHLLEDHYLKTKEEGEGSDVGEVGPIPIDEMSRDDQALLDEQAAREVWHLLARRHSDDPLTPDTSPQLDLGIDSMGWLNLTLEIREKTGVELSEETIARIDTVRDLLREVTEAAGKGAGPSKTASVFEQPEELIAMGQKRWLDPLGSNLAILASAMFALNRYLVERLFGLKVKGSEHLTQHDQFVITPNHISYLDSFAVAAALDQSILVKSYWGGWTGVVFSNLFVRFISRLARVVPVDPKRGVLSSLAFGAAVLKRGNNLIWYPEGQRSFSGALQPFKPGIGLLLHHYPVNVVPVLIKGTYEAMPPGRFPQRFRPITVVFGAPLKPQDLEQQGQGEQPQDRIANGLHDQIAEMQGTGLN